MKAWMLGALVGVFACPMNSIAAEPFTPAQLAEVKRMLSEQEDKIYRKVMAELEKNDAITATSTPSGQPPKATADQPPGSDVEKGLSPQTQITSADSGLSKGATPTESLPNAVAFGPSIQAIPADRGMRGKDALSGIELEFDEDSSEARATIAGSYSLDHPTRVSELAWSVTASSPIDDRDNGRANFLTLDGASSGLGIKLAVAHVSTKSVWSGNSTASEDWSKICVAAGLDRAGCGLQQVEQTYKESGSALLRSAIDEFIDKHTGVGTIIEGRIGASRNQYDYLAADLVKNDTTQNGWSVGSSIGFSNKKRNALYAFGFDIERAYEQEDEEIYCPANTAEPIQCVTGRLGPPSRITRRLAWFEARNAMYRFPFAVRLTHDFKNSNTGLDFPIYLFRGYEGVNGGFRMGWTDTDHFGAGIFIGAAFDVVK